MQGCRVLLKICSLNWYTEECIYPILFQGANDECGKGNSLSLIRASDNLYMVTKKE